MSTTIRFQPVLVGALVMGVLSALPLISAGNAFCCLWVVSGGVVAAYVLQQGQPDPISASDAAYVGWLAGLLGSLVYFIISIPINIAVGPLEQRLMNQLLDRIGGSDSLRGYADRSSPFAAPLIAFLGFLFFLFTGAVFSTVGGLIGAAMFRKSAPRAS